ncbi:four helix bundle protein [Tenacibaculum tangerinum]|uniref:Four helix bundle protein n=1 Tax=Tenacibaculum tangerinum TaxID=3038772 RepID=A0ABY8L6R0_9FLAO|nr:four helix bundle protein [Tenacibaculum tangerinum]WGH77062.1 four helix bundle protein [Tenacibaculum tangerinum]
MPIAEAFRKRQYPNHFKSKLSDADKNAETPFWLTFALACNYIDFEKKKD